MISARCHVHHAGHTWLVVKVRSGVAYLARRGVYNPSLTPVPVADLDPSTVTERNTSRLP